MVSSKATIFCTTELEMTTNRPERVPNLSNYKTWPDLGKENMFSLPWWSRVVKGLTLASPII